MASTPAPDDIPFDDMPPTEDHGANDLPAPPPTPSLESMPPDNDGSSALIWGALLFLGVLFFGSLIFLGMAGIGGSKSDTSGNASAKKDSGSQGTAKGSTEPASVADPGPSDKPYEPPPL